MIDGVFRVSIDGDAAEGNKHLRDAQQVLFSLQELLKHNGLECGGLSRRVSDSVYIYARIAGAIKVVNISVDTPDRKEPEPEKIPETFGLPEVMSGIVGKGYIVDGPNNKKLLDALYPTTETATRYKIDPGQFDKVAKLAVEPHFNELKYTGNNPEIVYSQCVKLKPTMFSGSMRACVQALMGMGRLRKNPSHKQALVPGEKLPKPNEYQREVQKNGYRIRYEWKFHKTHGLLKSGSDGKWWLVEISMTRGVCMMPMPLEEVTTTPGFRAKIDNSNDTESAAVLDKFGGFPSGETFPSDMADFDALVRAGWIIRVKQPDELQEFYQLQPYSSVMCWAFSESGSLANNTAWRMEDDNIQTGYHYQIAMQVGETPEFQGTETTAKVIGHAVSASASEKKRFAVKLKILRMGDASAPYLDLPKEAAFAAIDALEMDGMTSATAVLAKVAQGRLFMPKATENYSLLKFWEPLIEGGAVASHDLRPAVKVPFPSCDTIVFVFYAGERLKYLKYYFQPKEAMKDEVEDDYEECMYIGSWTRTQRTGHQGVYGNFYSDDLDERQELTDTVVTTKIKSTDMGYWGIVCGDDPSDIRRGYCSRSKRFERTTVVERVHGNRIEIGVAIPGWDREAYYYARINRHDGKTTSTTVSYTSLGDPYAYTTWRSFGESGYFGVPHPECGDRQPYRRAWKELYGPGNCSESDSGPWAEICDNLDAMQYNIPAPPTQHSTKTEPWKADMKVWLVSSRDPEVLDVKEKTWDTGGDLVSPYWFLPSPDPEMLIFHYIYTTRSVMGDAESVWYEAELNTVSLEDRKLHGAYQDDELKKRGPCYVGALT